MTASVETARDFSLDELGRIVGSDVHKLITGERKYSCSKGECDFFGLVVEAMVQRGFSQTNAKHVLNQAKDDSVIIGKIVDAITSDPQIAIP